MVETRGDSRLMAEVAGERDDADPSIGGGESLDHGERRVGAAVVDQEQLHLVHDVLDSGQGALAEDGDAILFVVDRCDERQLGRRQITALR